MFRPLLSLICSRPFWSGPAPVVAGLFLACNVGIAFWHGQLVEERKRNLTTGDVEGMTASAERRYDTTVGEDVLSSIPSVPDATKSRLVVVTGMSQMYTINDRQPGDLTLSEILDDRIRSEGTRVFGLSGPNLCNEEALFLLLLLLDRPQTKPHVFVYGNCFDKYRNVDLRPGYRKAMLAQPSVREAWQNTIDRYSLRYPAATEKMRGTLAAIEATAEQQQDDTLEALLRESVATVIPVVAARKDLSAFSELQFYYARNAVFGIKPSTKRPVIPARYELNQQLMAMMLDVAKQAGVSVVTYVIPLNPLSDNPYIPAQYAAYKSWLEGLASANGVAYVNLESVVPPEDWGEFMGGPDFKHFRGPGHRIVAGELLKRFRPMFVTDRQP